MTQSPLQNRSALGRSLLLLMATLLLLDLGSFLIAESFWFRELGYLRVFGTRVVVQGFLGLIGFGASLAFLFSNLHWASKQAWTQDGANEIQPIASPSLRLRGLLPLTIALSLTIAVLFLYYGQIALAHWHPSLTLSSATDQIPIKFRPESFREIGQQIAGQLWLLGVLATVTIALLIQPRLSAGAIAILMSLSFALVLSEHWADVLPFFSPTSFQQSDPVFSRDISFYVFALPVAKLLEFWLVGLFALTFLTVSLTYLLSGNSLSQGKFPGFSASQLRHLYRLGGCWMLTIAFSYWLDRYELLYSRQSISYGAGYTAIHAELPANTILALLALLLGVSLLVIKGIGGRGAGIRDWGLGIGEQEGGSRKEEREKWRGTQLGSSVYPVRIKNGGVGGRRSRPMSLRWHRLLYAVGAFVVLGAIAAIPLPVIVQNVIVQPNELELELPYLERAIAFTRQAFELDTIEVETFNPTDTLTQADLQRNDLTIDNIRLWDTRPLLETNRQLQRIRPYYEFPGADIDRYTLISDTGEATQQQVLIAARELDYEAVPQEAQTWVNQHLIYTHGYGFTLSPVNQVGEGGLPDYFIQGIEQRINDDRIRDSIPVANPRIYYGEISNTHVMTQTNVQELDYPSGSENVYNTYDGRGGVPIGHPLQRLLFAKHLLDWRMLFTEDFTPQTRLLYRRNINDRIRAIAPFLRYDNDPYLVVADPMNEGGFASSTPNYLYWIIDAYTTSDRYPYSDPNGNNFNYIRNSVKVVVDAYHGSVTFYVANSNDPIIQTWSRIFPGMFQPLDAMPVTLQRHIRYPQDFYRIQSDQLMVYHMTDPRVFYNREDQWRSPNEIYGDQPQEVQPYYLIMKLPTATGEEFILLRPFTPNQRTNLIAWLAARSDGDRYGKMLLYRFPKQELVFGPEQIEARINQDPVISQQISLWNRRGSRAIQGNLLVIPIENSLLYVEPLYLEAEQNRLPTLARVIVAYENRIVMSETLEDALDAIFETRSPQPPVVRPLDEESIPPT